MTFDKDDNNYLKYADANKRRPQEFFAKVYAHLLERYGSFLSDSRPKGEQKTWEKLLSLNS